MCLWLAGGDSALEAAASVADEPGTTVTLSYRGQAFGRARAKNRDRAEAAISEGRLKTLLGSEVQRIEAGRVIVQTAGGTAEIRNDAVIICAGGVLPTQFLKDAGIEVETKYGTV